MKKGKQIFILLLSTVLFGLSAIGMSLYDNIKKNTNHNVDQLVYMYEEDFKYLTLSLVNELHPDDELLTFDNQISEQTQSIITNKLYEDMQHAKRELLDDTNFYYRISDSITGKVISNMPESMKDDTSTYDFYGKLIYNQDSHCEASGAFSNSEFNDYNMLLPRYYINDDYLDYSASINLPSNIVVEYMIPEWTNSYYGISGYLNSFEYYNIFSCLFLLAGTAVLFILILCYPLKYVEEVNPFKTIKHFKAEFNLPFLTTIVFLGGLACMVVMGNTINGYLLTVFQNYDIKFANILVIVVNGITLIGTFLAIAMSIFQVKFIICHGVVRYLKEDTFVGSLIRYCKQKLDVIAEIDLSQPINKKIMKYVLINAVVVAIMVTCWGFGYILVIIYSFVLFFEIKKQVHRIQEDYNQLLHSAIELSKGHFNEEIKSDLGVFNTLKTEFNNIKKGFEKAVQEETKSQNMKTELISNVSHDLKTPLTCIKNYIVLLQDENLTEEERQDYLENLNHYSDRLATLIEDLFEVSKVNSGNIQINPVELNIVALLEQACAENSEALESKSLKVIKQYQSEEVILYLDGDKTYRIFENLLTNIGKYAMSNSRVYLNLDETDDEVIIQFKNMSEVEMNFTASEIIERFVRGDKSRHEAGSGLGLAIAKSFTEIQNGRFNIDIDGDLFKVTIVFSKNILPVNEVEDH